MELLFLTFSGMLFGALTAYLLLLKQAQASQAQRLALIEHIAAHVWLSLEGVAHDKHPPEWKATEAVTRASETIAQMTGRALSSGEKAIVVIEVAALNAGLASASALKVVSALPPVLLLSR